MENNKMNQDIKIAALYQFFRVADPVALQQSLLADALELGIKGTLLVAQEGINGTIAAGPDQLDAFLERLKRRPGLERLDVKISYANVVPFYRLKVKLKKEIVTLGQPGVDPLLCVGEYVEPRDWNALISDPEVLLIDTRNDYEVAIGRFKGAINPDTESFRELPDYIQEHIDTNKIEKVAMYCTGGIRCEKSTAYLKQYGVKHVYHLKGGILAYLEQVPEADSLWEGECFVFDNRVTVNHQLQPGVYDLCHACRFPIDESDKQSDHYKPGVSCPRCYQKKSAEDKTRFAERQKQIQLARVRGYEHLGQDQKQVAKG